jgi:hypothetical protein
MVFSRGSFDYHGTVPWYHLVPYYGSTMVFSRGSFDYHGTVPWYHLVPYYGSTMVFSRGSFDYHGTKYHVTMVLKVPRENTMLLFFVVLPW